MIARSQPRPEIELLLEAIHTGNRQKVEELLDKDATLINGMSESGTRPLEAAARAKNLEIATLLLNRQNPRVEVNPKEPIGNGLTALHWATIHDQPEMVELLLSNKAKPNAESKFGSPEPRAISGSKVQSLLRKWYSDNGEEIPSRVSPQDPLIQPLIKMMEEEKEGMYRNKPTYKGACNGLRSTAIQAMLTGNMDAFNKRYQILLNYSDNPDELLKRIKDVTEARKDFIKLTNAKIKSDENDGKNLQTSLGEWEQKLSEEEKILLDMPAFFDHVILSQHGLTEELLPANQKELAEEQILALSLPLVASTQLEEQGLYQAGGTSGIYDGDELHAYFTSFKEALEREHCQNPVMISMNNHNHAISMGYNPSTKEWTFIDVNNKPPVQTFKSESAAEDRKMVGLVLTSFASDVAAISARVLSTGPEHEKVSKSISQWKNSAEMKRIHEPTPEKANRTDSAGVPWIEMAVHAGDPEKVGTLFNLMNQENKEVRRKGLTAGTVVGSIAGVTLGLIFVAASILTAGTLPLIAIGIGVGIAAAGGIGGRAIATVVKANADRNDQKVLDSAVNIAKNNQKIRNKTEIIPQSDRKEEKTESKNSNYIARRLSIAPENLRINNTPDNFAATMTNDQSKATPSTSKNLVAVEEKKSEENYRKFRP